MASPVTYDTARKALLQHLTWQKEFGLDEVYVPGFSAQDFDPTRWGVSKSAAPALPTPPTAAPVAKLEPKVIPKAAPVPILTATSLAEHRQHICACTLCPLGHSRNNFVYGEGNPTAKIVFVGEAPGEQEDLQGRPFVGPAGELLTKILAAIQLTREDVFICNVLKCRPPQNRDPQPPEIDKCEPYLKQQLELIKPKIICALGRIAGQTLLKKALSLSSMRNKTHNYQGIPLLITYHPAALLRFPDSDQTKKYKRDTWEDMKTLRKMYDQTMAEVK